MRVGPIELSGPMVRAALDGDRRELFEAEFRAALVKVTRGFDVDELAEVVRRWWVMAGGDQAVADADRDKAVRAARLTDQNWEEPRPIYVPQVLVNRTGPAVRAALSGGELVEFETQFERALVEAASSFDHRPAARVVSRWWAVAITLANPDALSQDLETARRLATADPNGFPCRRSDSAASQWQPGTRFGFVTHAEEQRQALPPEGREARRTGGLATDLATERRKRPSR